MAVLAGAKLLAFRFVQRNPDLRFTTQAASAAVVRLSRTPDQNLAVRAVIAAVGTGFLCAGPVAILAAGFGFVPSGPVAILAAGLGFFTAGRPAILSEGTGVLTAEP